MKTRTPRVRCAVLVQVDNKPHRTRTRLTRHQITAVLPVPVSNPSVDKPMTHKCFRGHKFAGSWHSHRSFKLRTFRFGVLCGCDRVAPNIHGAVKRDAMMLLGFISEYGAILHPLLEWNQIHCWHLLLNLQHHMILACHIRQSLAFYLAALQRQ